MKIPHTFSIVVLATWLGTPMSVVAQEPACSDIVLVETTIQSVSTGIDRPEVGRDASFVSRDKPEESEHDLEATCYRFQLERVPLADFVQLFLGELLGLNYSIQAPLVGEVSVRSVEGLKRSQLNEVVEQLLERNGYRLETIAPNVLAINRVGEARGLGQVGIREDKANLGSSLHVVPLRFVAAGVAIEALAPFVDESILPAVNDEQDFLLVYASEATLDYLVNLLGYIDVNDLSSIGLGLVRIEHADPESVLETLENIFGLADLPSDAALVPPVHLSVNGPQNAISIISRSDPIFDRVLQWIERLDTPAASSEPRVRVYRPLHREASTIMELFEAIIPKTATSSLLERAINRTALIADDVSNSIVMLGNERDAKHLRPLFESLDKPSTRIEVRAKIIEVILNDNVEFGTAWRSTNALGQSYEGTSNLFTSGETLSTSGGFTYTLLNSDGEERALFSALSSIGTTNVVSSPFVAMLSGGSAFIHAGEQRPVPVGRVEVGSRGVAPGDPDSPGVAPDSDDDPNDPSFSPLIVEYRDVGVLLSVTASALANNLVRLTVAQETTDIGPLLQVTPEIQANSFLNRAVMTEVSIPSGTTVVLGRLQRDNASSSSAGIPFIRNIPLLGSLFGRKNRENRRTELLVLLTPEILPISKAVSTTTNEYKSELSAALKALQ